MPKFPFFRQLDGMDCGPTCLQMVAKYYGRYYSLQDIRTKSFVSREGVSLLAISEAAESIGFRTVGVKIPFEKLKSEALLPVIVHWNQSHFVVVYKFSKGRVYVADPSQGLLSYSETEFCNSWISSHVDNEDIGVVLLLEPLPAFYEYKDEKLTDKWKGAQYLAAHVRQHKKLILQLLLGLFTGSLIQLTFPFLTQSIIDIGIQTKNVNFIYLVLSGQLMLFAGRIAIEFVRRWILLHLSTRVNIAIVSDFIAKLFKLPISFFEGKLIGDLLRRIEDYSRIERFLSTSSLSILFSFFNLIFFGIVLAVYNLNIFLVFIGFSATYMIYVLAFMKKRSELDYKRFQENSNTQSNLVQIVQGMNEIKMNNSETAKRWEWERIQAKLFRVNISSLRLQQWQDLGGSVLNEVKNILITIMAALAVIDGQMTLGMMLAVQYIIGQLNVPINDFVVFIRDWQDAKISLERIGDIHSIENEEKPELVNTHLPEGHAMKATNLCFQYEGPNSPEILSGINLIIPEGKITAIVGSSGSGKTTLMKLLLKFYSPTSGTIKLADINMEQISHEQWRRNCGVVMQDGYIFSDTIANNIALATDMELNHKRLIDAVNTANIRSFIEDLPLNYNTKVGMNGVGLSQGQKQRLLIARAIYKNPQVLFFDEATSALDANNEKIIMENLNLFFKGRTVIVIAHRLSTVKNADQIIVLDNGVVAEVGNHTTLTKERGKYFELVKNQLELGN